MKIPVSELRVKDTHRLIASRFSDSGTVLSRLSANTATLSSLLELDDATNDRFLGEEGLLPGIGIHELVYGIRYAHIVNAAFTHASPAGGRFNSPARGAWYASLDRSTSLAEIAFHKLRHLEEIDWTAEEVSTSDDYLADLTSPFHDLRFVTPANAAAPVVLPTANSLPWVASAGDASTDRDNPSAPSSPPERVGSARKTTGSPHAPEPGAPPPENPFTSYLRPDPIPRCYARPQRLAQRLLSRKSNGIIYPSVRQPGGTCIAVFRPALVYNVRRGERLELRLRQGRPFRAFHAREVPIPKS